MADLHKICVAAVNAMVRDGIIKHISYISEEDEVIFGLRVGGKIPKVTIEWVDVSEAEEGVANGRVTDIQTRLPRKE